MVFPTGEKIYTYDDLIDTIIPYDHLNRELGLFSSCAHILFADENRYWFIRDQQIGTYRISGSDIDSLFIYNLAMQGIHLGKSFPRIVNLGNKPGDHYDRKPPNRTAVEFVYLSTGGHERT